MKKSKSALLTEGPIGSTLVKLTIPMVLGILGMVLFNLVDTYFVGQLGTAQLAAISFTFPIIFMLGSLAMGLGVGTAAVISRAIGEGDHYKVQRLTTDSLTLALVVVSLFVIIGLLTVEPVFRMLGATPDLIPLIKQYMYIWYPGVLFVIVPMVGNNAIRATGDTKTPSLIMLVAVVTNIALDPLLIFGWGPIPGLGLTGAAIATVTARAVTLIVSMWVLYYREQMITFSIPDIKTGLNSWKQILYIGLPAAGTNMIMPVGTGIITSLIATYGAEEVAAYGVATRLDMFAITVIMALSSVLGPFIGQNLGAGQLDRVQKGIRYSQGFSVVWGASVFLLFLFIARPVVSLFTDHQVVIETAVSYLHIFPLGYGLFGVLLLSNTSLNVLNKPFNASVLTILQMFGLYVPLAYSGSYLFGLTGIFTAGAIANLIAGTVAFWWLQRTVKKQAQALLEQTSVESDIASSPLDKKPSIEVKPVSS